MTLKGKAVRFFAATLVLASQIASATTVEGTGSNSDQPASSLVAPNSSALPILNLQKDEPLTLPNGQNTSLHEEVVIIHAGSREELEDLLRFELKRTVDAGGKMSAVNFDGEDSDNSIHLDAPDASVFSSENIPLPYDVKKSIKALQGKYIEWSANYKKRREDFKPFEDIREKTQTGKENRTNLTLAILRFSGIFLVPLTVAVTTSNIPVLAALPFALSIAAVSGSTQFYNSIMPYNDKNLSFSTKLAMWYVTELAFNTVAQLVMMGTNFSTSHFAQLHTSYFDLLPFKSLFATSAFGLASQGLFDLSDYTLYSRGVLSRKAFDIATLLVSFTSVSLATSRTYGWAGADWGFWGFILAGVGYSTAVYLRGPSESRPKIVAKCQGALRSLRTLH